MRRPKRMMGRINKRKKWYSLASLGCIIVMLVGICVAWFTNSISYVNGRLILGKMQIESTIYAADGTQVGEPVTSDLSGRVSLTGENGLIYAENISNYSVSTRYLKVVNRSSMDVRLSFSFDQITEKLEKLSNIYDAGYIYLMVTDISESIDGSAASGNTDVSLAAYAGEPSNTTTVTRDNANEVIRQSYRLNELKNDTRILLGNSQGVLKKGATGYFKVEIIGIQVTDNIVRTSDGISEIIALDTTINVQQASSPWNNEADDSTITHEVSGKDAFLKAVQSAGSGDTIMLSGDVELDDAYNLTFYHRVNLYLNGHTLDVRGNLAYNYTDAGTCTLNISNSSTLKVAGAFDIDTPNASFVLEGDGSGTFEIGYSSKSESFTVNCLRGEDGSAEGYTQSRVTVLFNSVAANMQVQSNTAVTIESNSMIGTITAVDNARNISIINNGSIKNIELSRMSIWKEEDAPTQIYIEKNGIFTAESTNEIPISLPSWSKGAVTCQSKTSTDDEYEGRVNTTVKQGAGISGTLFVKVMYNGQAYSAASRDTYTGENAADADNVYFWNRDVIYNTIPAADKVKRTGTGTYTVSLDAEDDSVEALMKSYFAGEGSSYAAEDLISLTVLTYGEAAMKAADFTYITNTAKTTIQTLDLGKAALESNNIPSSAMKDCTSLSNLYLPSTVVEIGSNAFNGCNITDLTLPSTLVKVESNAFQQKDSQRIYVRWDGITAIPAAVLSGFSNTYTRFFMTEYLASNLRDNTTWGPYAYEDYDFIDGKTYLKIIAANDVRIVYYDDTASSSSTGSDGDTGMIRSSYTDPATEKTYDTKSIGINAYRYAWKLLYDSNKNASIVLKFPDSCTDIRQAAFRPIDTKNPFLFSELGLNNVTDIGEYAFYYAKIQSFSDRPTSFAGMTTLGDYAFAYVNICPKDTDTTGEENSGWITPSALSANRMEAYQTSDAPIVYPAGTLDLHAADGTSLRVYYAIYKLSAAGTEINLSNYAMIGNCTDSAAWTGAAGTAVSLYGVKLDISGCTQLSSLAFYDSFSNSDLQDYNELDIRNVHKFGGRVFGSSCIGTVYAGVTDESYHSQSEVDKDFTWSSPAITSFRYDYRIFYGSTGTQNGIHKLDVSGYLPSVDGDSSIFCKTKYESVYVHDLAEDTKIPDYFVYGSTVETIDILPTNSLELGEYAFANAAISSFRLDAKGNLTFGKCCFRYAAISSLCITGTNVSMKDSNFNGSSLYELNITSNENLSFGKEVFRYANVIPGEKGITITVCGDYTGEGSEFREMNLNNYKDGGNISLTFYGNVTLGSYAFYQSRVKDLDVVFKSDLTSYGAESAFNHIYFNTMAQTDFEAFYSSVKAVLGYAIKGGTFPDEMTELDLRATSCFAITSDSQYSSCNMNKINYVIWPDDMSTNPYKSVFYATTWSSITCFDEMATEDGKTLGLGIAGKAISGESMFNGASFPQLTKLNLANTKLLSYAMFYGCSMASLAEIDLTGAVIEKNEMFRYVKFNQVTTLTLENTQITGNYAFAQGGFESLKELNLSSVTISGAYTFERLTFKSLTDLKLNGATISGGNTFYNTTFDELRSLDLTGANITGSSTFNSAKFEVLASLNVKADYTDKTDGTISSSYKLPPYTFTYANLTHLTELDLADTFVQSYAFYNANISGVTSIKTNDKTVFCSSSTNAEGQFQFADLTGLKGIEWSGIQLLCYGTFYGAKVASDATWEFPNLINFKERTNFASITEGSLTLKFPVLNSCKPIGQNDTGRLGQFDSSTAITMIEFGSSMSEVAGIYTGVKAGDKLSAVSAYNSEFRGMNAVIRFHYGEDSTDCKVVSVMGSNILDASYIGTVQFIVPDNQLENYKSTSPWSNVSDRIHANTSVGSFSDEDGTIGSFSFIYVGSSAVENPSIRLIRYNGTAEGTLTVPSTLLRSDTYTVTVASGGGDQEGGGTTEEADGGSEEDSTTTKTVEIATNLTVTEIDESLLDGISGITTVRIPSTVNYIDMDLFAAGSVTSVQFYQVSGTEAVYKAVTYGESDTSDETAAIDAGTASSDSSGNLILSKDGTVLYKVLPKVFTGELILPSGITAIADGAFAGTTITSLTLPGSIESIAGEAFTGSKICTMIFTSENPPALLGDVFHLFQSNSVTMTPLTSDGETYVFSYEYIDLGSNRIYVPSESLTVYKAATGYAPYASIIMVQNTSESAASTYSRVCKKTVVEEAEQIEDNDSDAGVWSGKIAYAGWQYKVNLSTGYADIIGLTSLENTTDRVMVIPAAVAGAISAVDEDGVTDTTYEWYPVDALSFLYDASYAEYLEEITQYVVTVPEGYSGTERFIYSDDFGVLYRFESTADDTGAEEGTSDAAAESYTAVLLRYPAASDSETYRIPESITVSADTFTAVSEDTGTDGNESDTGEEVTKTVNIPVRRIASNAFSDESGKTLSLKQLYIPTAVLRNIRIDADAFSGTSDDFVVFGGDRAKDDVDIIEVELDEETLEKIQKALSGSDNDTNEPDSDEEPSAASEDDEDAAEESAVESVIEGEDAKEESPDGESEEEGTSETGDLTEES